MDGLRRSEAELAAKAGTSRSTIALLETGRACELGFNKIMRILGALGLELKLGEANAGRPTLDDLLAELEQERSALASQRRSTSGSPRRPGKRDGTA
jgi:transcriptional regulator with XRE-family HTH domain